MTAGSRTAPRSGPPPDAHLIVIGAMKCGTSTLFAHLARHPAIASSKVKEPEYFSEYQGHGVEVGAYAELWDHDLATHRYFLEASTGYAKYPAEPHVPDRMLRAGVDPRFVYVVRDPLDRIESQFNHARVRRTAWAYDDFLEPGLLNPSRYYMQLQQFLLRFPDRDRYRIVDFDRLVESPTTVTEGLFRWLGLNPVEVPGDLHENRTPEPSRLELMLADVDLSGPLSLVPSPAKDALRSALRAVAPGKKRMSERDRERARGHLRRDVRLFGDAFDFPVGKWGF